MAELEISHSKRDDDMLETKFISFGESKIVIWIFKKCVTWIDIKHAGTTTVKLQFFFLILVKLKYTYSDGQQNLFWVQDSNLNFKKMGNMDRYKTRENHNN